MMSVVSIIGRILLSALVSILLYALFVCLLAVPFVQDNVIYLHKVTLTWFQNLNEPEQWGFLHNQVTPFQLHTPDGETLHAWHILPLGIYCQHEKILTSEPSGLVSDITARHSFSLLRQDPEARLVLYFHGAAGTLGSGYRPPSYRAITAGSHKIHIIAIDYRGFGLSTGKPSEEGLITDALTLARWAMDTAGISPGRIALFGQSLGTAVAVSLAHQLALQKTPLYFSGMVLVAPFADVETLTRTYRIAGTIPLLSPLARFPGLLSLLHRFLISRWPSKEKLAELIRTCERRAKQGRLYDTTIIHAQDDYDISWSHSDTLYWHVVNATALEPISYDALGEKKASKRRVLGAGGWKVEHRYRHCARTDPVAWPA